MSFVHQNEPLSAFVKRDPTCLTANGHILESTASFICMCSSQKPSLSLFSANAYSHILHCARWRRYGFCSPLRPSPPILWKWSCSVTGFGLLRSALSPHETCFMPAERKTQLTNTEKVVFAQMQATNGASRHMFLGREEEFRELCLGKKTSRFQPSTWNKEWAQDHQGIVEILVCLNISRPEQLERLSLWLCAQEGHLQPPWSQMKSLPPHLKFKHLIKAFVWHGIKTQSQLL